MECEDKRSFLAVHLSRLSLRSGYEKRRASDCSFITVEYQPNGISLNFSVLLWSEDESEVCSNRLKVNGASIAISYTYLSVHSITSRCSKRELRIVLECLAF